MRVHRVRITIINHLWLALVVRVSGVSGGLLDRGRWCGFVLRCPDAHAHMSTAVFLLRLWLATRSTQRSLSTYTLELNSPRPNDISSFGILRVLPLRSGLADGRNRRRRRRRV